MTDELPRIVTIAELEEGDLVEITIKDYPDYFSRRRVMAVGPDYVRFYCERASWMILADGRPDTRVFNLIERPGTDEHTLPSAVQTVITCTLDGKVSAIMVKAASGWWHGVDANGMARNVPPKQLGYITDWAVVEVEPTPKLAHLLTRKSRFTESTDNG